MTKYYRVVKDHPMWEVGAIIEKKEGSYHAVSDLWDRHDFLNSSWYEAGQLVEASDFFERVYNTSWLGKQVYLTKDKARKMADDLFKGESK